MSAILKLQKQPYPYLVQQTFSRMTMDEQIEVLKDNDLTSEMLFTIVSMSRGVFREDLCRISARNQNANESTLLWLVSLAGHHDDIMEDILKHRNAGAKTLLEVAKLGLETLNEIIRLHPEATGEVLAYCQPAEMYIQVSQFSLPAKAELYSEFKARQSSAYAIQESKGPMKAMRGYAVYRVNKDLTMAMTDSKWDSSD